MYRTAPSGDQGDGIGDRLERHGRQRPPTAAQAKAGQRARADAAQTAISHSSERDVVERRDSKGRPDPQAGAEWTSKERIDCLQKKLISNRERGTSVPSCARSMAALAWAGPPGPGTTNHGRTSDSCSAVPQRARYWLNSFAMKPEHPESVAPCRTRSRMSPSPAESMKVTSVRSRQKALVEAPSSSQACLNSMTQGPRILPSSLRAGIVQPSPPPTRANFNMTDSPVKDPLDLDVISGYCTAGAESVIGEKIGRNTWPMSELQR